MSSYQYSEVEPKGINSKSYEPEIESWLKGTAGEIDCVEDAQFGTQEHLDFAPRPSEHRDECFWTFNDDIGMEEEEPMLYGLSDDDLETLTIIDPEEELALLF